MMVLRCLNTYCLACWNPFCACEPVVCAQNFLSACLLPFTSFVRRPVSINKSPIVLVHALTPVEVATHTFSTYTFGASHYTTPTHTFISDVQNSNHGFVLVQSIRLCPQQSTREMGAHLYSYRAPPACLALSCPKQLFLFYSASSVLPIPIAKLPTFLTSGVSYPALHGTSCLPCHTAPKDTSPPVC